MSRITPSGKVERIDRRSYITRAQIRHELGAGHSGLVLIVPAGFRFDVSVPRPLWPVFDPHDPRYLVAAALHDYALHRLRWSREAAAAPFGEALRAAGVGRVRRLAMVLAVIVWRWS